MKKLSDHIPPNLRTLMILEVLGRAEEALTPTQINAEIGLPKQTIHRLCKTLLEAGYLTREEDGKRLRPSRRSRLFGAGLLHASRSHILRRQVLMDIANKVGETVNYVVAEENGMRYLDRVETDWPFRIQLDIGSNVPFHATASGKTFLAALKPAARKRFVRGLPLKRLTENTITDPDVLLEELATVAKAGHCLDREEFFEGMVALAVPVKDPLGRFVAAIAFHGPTQRLSVDEMLGKKELLVEGAQKLQEGLI